MERRHFSDNLSASSSHKDLAGNMMGWPTDFSTGTHIYRQATIPHLIEYDTFIEYRNNCIRGVRPPVSSKAACRAVAEPTTANILMVYTEYTNAGCPIGRDGTMFATFLVFCEWIFGVDVVSGGRQVSYNGISATKCFRRCNVLQKAISNPKVATVRRIVLLQEVNSAFFLDQGVFDRHTNAYSKIEEAVGINIDQRRDTCDKAVAPGPQHPQTRNKVAEALSTAASTFKDSIIKATKFFYEKRWPGRKAGTPLDLPIDHTIINDLPDCERGKMARKVLCDARKWNMPLCLKTGQRLHPLVFDLGCGGGGASAGLALAGVEVIGVDIIQHAEYPFKFIHMDAFEFLEHEFPKYKDRVVFIFASPNCQGYSGAISAKMREQFADKFAQDPRHAKSIPKFRKALQKTGVPYAIENVQGAVRDMRVPVKVDGTMFGLRVIRRRYFELSPGLREAVTVERKSSAGTARLGKHSPNYNRKKKGTDPKKNSAASGLTKKKIQKKRKSSQSGKRTNEVISVVDLYAPDAPLEYFAVWGQHSLKVGANRGTEVEWAQSMGGRLLRSVFWMRANVLKEAIPPSYTEYLGRKILQALHYVVDYPPVTYIES